MSGASDHSEIVIYQTDDGGTKIDVQMMDETVWLSIGQMSELFQVDKSGISRHLKNIFESGELIRDSVVANFATTESRLNSPRSKMFFKCFEIPDLST